MAIKSKTIQKEQSSIVGSGFKKYYALPVCRCENKLKGLIQPIEKISTINNVDIRAVLYILIGVIQKDLFTFRQIE